MYTKSMVGAENLLDRITLNPAVMVGKPTIRGFRITVEQILLALAAGVSQTDLLADYPELEPEFSKASSRACSRVMLLPLALASNTMRTL
jgi:uncharacterized protein (DUF433 family)